MFNCRSNNNERKAAFFFRPGNPRAGASWNYLREKDASPEAIATQRSFPSLNGRRHTFFCGSNFCHGFHENALRSGVKVAEAFGIHL